MSSSLASKTTVSFPSAHIRTIIKQHNPFISQLEHHAICEAYTHQIKSTWKSFMQPSTWIRAGSSSGAQNNIVNVFVFVFSACACICMNVYRAAAGVFVLWNPGQQVGCESMQHTDGCRGSTSLNLTQSEIQYKLILKWAFLNY